MDSKNISIEEDIKQALEAVVDPELGISIVTLGLVRDIIMHPSGDDQEAGVEIVMTLTSPLCPFADAIIEDVENTVSVLGYGICNVTITFNPPWEASQELKLMLGI